MMNCNQCEMLSINGMACHETGCPNSRKRWDAEGEEWIGQYKCMVCGYMADEGSECCNDDMGDDA